MSDIEADKADVRMLEAGGAASAPLVAYDYGAMLLHWLMALLIIIQLGMGYVMQRLEMIVEPSRFAMMQWHKTFGILVLVLTVARIFWRFANPPPPHAPMPMLELVAARVVAFLFYSLMLLVPLTGWWLVSVSPLDIATFFFTIPGLEWPHLPLPAGEGAETLASWTHMILSYGFVLLLFLHIGGALKHVVIDRIPEMARILPGSAMPRRASSPTSHRLAWGLVVGVTALGLLIGQLPRFFAPATTPAVVDVPPAAQQASGWVVDYAQSSLTFSTAFSGEVKQGQVASWQTHITFDEQALETARAEVTIDAGSLTYEDAYVSGSIPGADGLDVANYPRINVVLDQFSRQGAAYRASGTLTIKGVSLPLNVDFTYEEEDGWARVSGSAEIDRLSFNIGTKTDGSGRYLGTGIRIDFSLIASRQ